MKEHFDIGTRLINLYSIGELNIEYVELSSMLDSLNDIGNVYEDLVTVSSNNNNVDINITKNKLDNAKVQIEYANKLNAIYPEKIHKFATDFYEKANYINSLKEENEIKNGLIISKNQHAIELANWSEKFANLYIDEYIKDSNISIDYNNTNITNDDVIATLKTTDNVIITNNNGKNEYTFTKNGTFTFKYEVLGKKDEIIAKVENIDKENPSITGIIDGKEYNDITLIPNIIDKNLNEVILIKDGQIVSYQIGDKISGYGKYKLIAKDKAGNKTEINFNINNSKKETYEVEDNVITSTYINQTIEEYKRKFNYISEEYNIYRENKKLTNKEYVATGDLLVTKSNKEYIIIVSGDLNKDGKVNITDIMMMKQYIIDNMLNDDNVIKAADLNRDGKINITDVMKLKNKVVYYD